MFGNKINQKKNLAKKLKKNFWKKKFMLWIIGMLVIGRYFLKIPLIKKNTTKIQSLRAFLRLPERALNTDRRFQTRTANTCIVASGLIPRQFNLNPF